MNLIGMIRLIMNTVVRIFLKLYCDLKIAGVENLPKGKSYILVANHSSHLDASCLLTALPFRMINQTFAVGAKDYFKSPLRHFFTSIFFNLLLLDRIHTPCASLKHCFSLLSKNKVLILFPEGARSDKGDITLFKPGVGFLTAGTPFSVVPAFIDGAFAAWPKKAWFPRSKKVRVKIGPALDFSELPRTKTGFIQATKEIQNAVENLKDVV